MTMTTSILTDIDQGKTWIKDKAKPYSDWIVEKIPVSFLGQEEIKSPQKPQVAPACPRGSNDSRDKQVPPPVNEDGSSEPNSNEQDSISEFDFSSIKSALDSVSELFAESTTPNVLMREVEGLVALFFSISGASNGLSICSSIFLYASRLFSDSLSLKIMEIVYEIFDIQANTEEPPTRQSGLEGVILVPRWIQMLRNARTNWELVRSNKLFKHFSRLLSLVVTMGMCEVSSVTFNVGNYKVIEPDMSLIHADSVDLIDAALSTVTFFVENIYVCFKDKSLRCFLIGNKEALELDDEYMLLLQWWDLVRNGNLEKHKKASEKEFDLRFENCTKCLRVLVQGKHGIEKSIFEKKILKLCTIRNEYVTLKLATGLRKAPFALELYGRSCQGKTTCGMQIVDCLLASAGLPTGMEHKASVNASDRYMSNWATNKLVMIFDDMANDKKDFIEKAPTRALIDVINNNPFYANMAEIESKGKVFVEPEIVVVNTNVKTLDAHTYSQCPYAIQRRMKYVLTVAAREEFQLVIDGKECGLDPTKVRDCYGDKMSDIPVDDLWYITIEQAVEPKDLRHVAQYAVVKEDGITYAKVSIKTAVQFLITKYHQHRAEQEFIIRNKSRTINLCPAKGCKQIKGLCNKHDTDGHSYDTVTPEDSSVTEESEPEIEVDETEMALAIEDAKWFKSMTKQSGFEVFTGMYIYNRCANYVERKIFGDPNKDSWEHRLSKAFGYDYNHGDCLARGWDVLSGVVTERADEAASHTSKTVDAISGIAMLKMAKMLRHRWSWLKLVPTPWIEDPRIQNMLRVFESREIAYKFFRWTFIQYSISSLLLLIAWYRGGFKGFHFIFTCCFLLAITSTVQKKMVATLDELYVRDLAERNSIAPTLKAWRDDNARNICRTALAVGIVYTLAKIYRVIRNKPKSQGTLMPENAEQIAARDKEINPWATPGKREFPFSHQALCTNKDDFVKIVERNLVYGSVETTYGIMALNALFVKTGVMIVPNHYFTDANVDTLKCTFRKSAPLESGGMFPAYISLKTAIRIPDTDLVACYCHAGGSFKDLTPWFPISQLPELPFTLVYRSKDGKVTTAKGMAVPKDGIDTGVGVEFSGGCYKNFGMDTFKGLCGAVVVAEAKGVNIAGFHLGGRDGTPYGVYGSVLKSTLDRVLDELATVETVLVTGSFETMPSKQMGMEVMQPSAKLHYKSCLNYMPNPSQIEYYGGCFGMTTPSTSVKVTPISEHVMDIMELPNIYGPPTISPRWFGWQKCIASLSQPAQPFPPELLQKAVADFKVYFIPIFQRPEWRDTLRPLTYEENLHGIPGIRFIDPIHLDTSIGYPGSGPKSRHVEYDEKGRAVKFVPVVQDEIDRSMACYERGERAGSVAKGCLKDEVIAYSEPGKQKCRTIYASTLALTFNVRGHFLPLIRAIQMNPLICETAVGINAHSREWEQLYKHITQHGEERMIAGDYKSYDQKLSSQLLLASIRLLIDAARELPGYTERDIRIMEAMAGDLVYALIAFNGDLIGLICGGHISGNSLTVILNGFCGLLNLRCCFFSLYPEVPVGNFKDCVALTTYGDDNGGTVAPGYEKFNIKSISEFLAQYGQTYTMPDKESELVPYLDPRKFEFLKRKNVYIPEIDCNVGALLETSVAKSLHCFVRDKGSPLSVEQACAQNIDNTCYEWFFHGKDVYERRRKELIMVAEMAGLKHMTNRLDTTFEEFVDKWKERHEPQEGETEADVMARTAIFDEEWPEPITDPECQ
jgi:hypothetical protein